VKLFALKFGSSDYLCNIAPIVQTKTNTIMKNLMIKENTKVVKVTTLELVQILMTITKSMFGSVIYFVDEGKSRSVKGKKVLQKRVFNPSIVLNHKYGQKVNNLLKKALKDGLVTAEQLLYKYGFDVENDVFVPREMKGKTRVSSSLVQADKTKAFILDAKSLKNATPKVQLFHNNQAISRQEAIEQNLFTPSALTSKPKTKGRGLLPEELDFEFCAPYVERIEFLKLNNTVYEVIKG
jgi:hypothetical protein